MMKANEIFSKMNDETAGSVFQFLRDEERKIYSATLSTLATNRKLRPIFVQKKPVAQQIEWLVKNIRLRGSSEVAENVLQYWLMNDNSEMLIAFLDGLGIEHDGEGSIEEIPDEIDEKKLKKTVDQLLKDHEPERVKIYLHTFQMQKPDGWMEIDSLISENTDLQFDSEDGEEEEKPAPAKKEAEPKKEDKPKKEDEDTE